MAVQRQNFYRNQYRHDLSHLASSLRQLLTGQMSLEKAWHGALGFFYAFEDFAWDRKLGIETGGYDSSLSRQLSKFGDMIPYMPTPYRLLPPVLAALRLKPDDVLVDLGSGKGRVVLLAASIFRLRKAIGIEIDQRYLEIAEENVKRACCLLTPVEFIQGDAAQIIPEDASAIFLFNPFGIQTMTCVYKALEQSIASTPRNLRIAYFNPVHRKLFDQAPWLRAMPVPPKVRFCVWESRMT